MLTLNTLKTSINTGPIKIIIHKNLNYNYIYSEQNIISLKF